MNILVDGQTLHTNERNRGIGRYFLSTLDALLCLDDGSDFLIVTPEDVDFTGLPLSFKQKARFRRLNLHERDVRVAGTVVPDDGRMQVELNRIIEEERIDLYWNPNPLMPNVGLPGKIARCKFAATVFDLIPLRLKNQYMKKWPRHIQDDYMTRLTGKLYGYDRLLAISWSTKADLIDCLNISSGLIDVVYLGVGDIFFDSLPESGIESVKSKYSLKKEYILYTGGFDFRKNMERLLYGYSRFMEKYNKELDLVIVCAYDAERHGEFSGIIKKARLDGRVILTNHVSDGDLTALYRGARLFVFPSLYEGFGLPVLEALACGTPVAASAISSVQEVLGNFGSYFDPYNIEDIADGLHGMLSAKDSAQYVDNGVRLAKQFSWQATAQKTMHIFEHLVYGGKS